MVVDGRSDHELDAVNIEVDFGEYSAGYDTAKDTTSSRRVEPVDRSCSYSFVDLSVDCYVRYVLSYDVQMTESSYS